MKRGSEAKIGLGRATSDTNVLATRIRVTRRHKGLKLDQVAKAANLDKGYLSRIERGQKTPSIAALLRIAEALNVKLAHLFGEATVPDAITVVRKDEHVRMPGSAAGSEPIVEAIIPASGTRQLTAFLAAPGPKGDLENAEHPGDELMYVLQGSVEVTFADQVVTLQAGDCAQFDGHLSHRMREIGRARARVLIVIADDLPT